MRRYDAIVFDMDGVLLDSEPLHYAALNTALGRDGLRLGRDEYEHFIGTRTEAMLSDLIARYQLPRSQAEYLRDYDAAVVEQLQEPRSPADGVGALMQFARGLGMRLGLGSSSRRLWIDATLRSLGLAGAFDAIVSGDEVSVGKPDPQIYLLAATRLGIPPTACLAIEDAPNGVASARAAGMTVLGVRTPYTAHLQLADVMETVDSLADLDLDQWLKSECPRQDSNLRP
jgi:HAD superfamily hydrolase (TIGR01509 family)